MVTLLRDGFGFHPSSKDITFTYLVEGSEVEWTLGMALSLFAEEQSPSAIGSDYILDADCSSPLLGAKNGNCTMNKNEVSPYMSAFFSEIVSSVPYWVSFINYHEIINVVKVSQSF